MRTKWGNYPARAVTLFIALGVLLSGVFLQSTVHALTLNVEDSGGASIGVGYRWLVEEDATFQVVPGDPGTNFSFEFHRSYMPVVAAGDNTTPPTGLVLDPAKHYIISVLPDSGFTIGGAAFPGSQASVTVSVNALPIPTAQITVFVFEDNHPLNNAPEIPQEQGLQGFSVFLAEAGGKYGIPGGQVTQDAFGNPLGTTYNPDGSVLQLGTGEIFTDADGIAVIKNLPPAKYGITVHPPAGENWQQTTTIEGTKTIDAWVRAGEPPVFTEFGFPGPHVFMGFVQPISDPTVIEAGTQTISGQVVNLHLNRPPSQLISEGHAMPNAWVALNDSSGKAVYAQPADPDTGEFSIPNVPPGAYQLVIWDKFLDIIIAFRTVNVPLGGGDVVMGQIPVNDWFAHSWHFVFWDADGDGFPDDLDADGFPVGTEPGMPEQAVNLRFRDGTVYQSFPTDVFGFVPFDEIFPFFHWLVAEVDFARYKATGLTVVVDAGGTVNAGNTGFPDFGRLNPQQQDTSGADPDYDITTDPSNVSPNWRIETGEVLTQGSADYAGNTNVFYWGKGHYAEGENGGISGIVFYAVTRAEDDPRYAAGEEWEPGIPGVQVNLYEDLDGNGIIDDRNGDGEFTVADAIQTTTTDSWDDSLPDNCPGPAFSGPGLPDLTGLCYDGWTNWNQVRPAVFDGGYAFGGLSPGTYIVEVVTPPGYVLLKEEDRNVDFGDEYQPTPALLPPVCVGDVHTVPAELSLFPGIPSAFAGEERSLCDRKQVSVVTGKNAAADFWLFTEVPIAGHFVGLVNNDLAAEADPRSPNIGEKSGLPWVPVAFRDHLGKEVIRVYTDEHGRYNGVVPSTYTVNIPSPSGMSPAMYQVCINDPGPIEVSPGVFDIDPNFKPQFSNTCLIFQFMPGSTTYLDTPVVPVAAFATAGAFPLDCEYETGTPRIYSASGPSSSGPYVSATGEQLTITSVGPREVPNPAFNPSVPGSPKTISRDYGFGNVSGSVTLAGVALENVSWSDGTITGTVAAGTPAGPGQLMITRGDSGLSTVSGLTVTVGTVGVPSPTYVSAGGSIQAAIDAAAPGDLIIVEPGVWDQELPIMWKPVRLQGWGEGSTIINAVKTNPADKLLSWRAKIDSLNTAGDFDLLPGQTAGPIFNEVGLFAFAQGAGITVLAKQSGPNSFVADPNARIDGFTIMTADAGGGIFVNGYAPWLEISNNRFLNNAGNFGGAIRVGHPVAAFGFDAPVDSMNDNIHIHHNHINQNGAVSPGVSAGGGISLYTGSDNYVIDHNYICGNHTPGSGGAIGHSGLSDGGQISYNSILFNESFDQTVTDNSGGGIAIMGMAGTGGALTTGSGSILITGNLIQGNLAGSGDGSAIRLNRINGTDVQDNPLDSSLWHTVDIVNNMIVNNVTALAGAISLQDAARVNIINNTLAHNDSTATAGVAFNSATGVSTPQPAGIASRAHTAGLWAELQPLGEMAFPNPTLLNNILWQNRSFYFDVSENGGTGGLLPDPSAPDFRDLAVLGTGGSLNPDYSIITSLTGFDGSNYNDGTNLEQNPKFVSTYFNGPRTAIVTDNPITVGAVVEEGGNFANVDFGPLAPVGNYHIRPGSPAIAAALTAGAPVDDFDGETRGDPIDIGADEFSSAFLVADRIGFFRPNSNWYLDLNGNYSFDGDPPDILYVPFGGAGDIPITGDWNGDGITEIGTYRPSRGWFILDYNGNGKWDGTLTDRFYWYGLSTDIPITGDWNGDGHTDIGVYRPSKGWFVLDYNGNGQWDGTVTDRLYWYGVSTDIPITGDWNGDGITEIGTYRPSKGWFVLDYNGNGHWDGAPTDRVYVYGASGDIPVAGDWNADGAAEIGVFRPSQALWQLDYNGNGKWDGSPADILVESFGTSTDIPVVGAW